MGDIEEILYLIEQGVENERVDFKQDYYLKEKRADLIKDICAFANGESNEAKYIVFGVSDQNFEVCGISGDLEDVSNINQLIEENIEPFIDISMAVFDYNRKNIGYIKIHDNKNRPYVIKREYGKGRILKKGDIYIRKGATIFKALRNDLDIMYSKKYRKQVSICDDFLYIGNVNNKADLSIVAGNIQIQFINESDMSITFKYGYITIENQFGKIDRNIITNEGTPLNENPYELDAKTQKAENFLFMFGSSDCVTLNFDEEGNMNYPTKAKVTFIDLEKNEYSCAFTDVSLLAEGDILHKIKRKYQSFRQFLKKEQSNLIQCIIQDDREKLRKILNEGHSHFELIQSQYGLVNDNSPEYQCTYNLIRDALLRDEKILTLFQQHGLSKDFIDSCRDIKED